MYIKINIFLEDTALAGLGLKNNSNELADCLVNLDDIQYIVKSPLDNSTMIGLKSGQNLITNAAFDELQVVIKTNYQINSGMSDLDLMEDQDNEYSEN